MTPKELLEACESVMKSFNPHTTTVDDLPHRRLGPEAAHRHNREGVPSFEILSTDDRHP